MYTSGEIWSVLICTSTHVSRTHHRQHCFYHLQYCICMSSLSCCFVFNLKSMQQFILSTQLPITFLYILTLTFPLNKPIHSLRNVHWKPQFDELKMSLLLDSLFLTPLCWFWKVTEFKMAVSMYRFESLFVQRFMGFTCIV